MPPYASHTRFTVGRYCRLLFHAHLTPFGKKGRPPSGHYSRFTVGQEREASLPGVIPVLYQKRNLSGRLFPVLYPEEEPSMVGYSLF